MSVHTKWLPTEFVACVDLGEIYRQPFDTLAEALAELEKVEWNGFESWIEKVQRLEQS